MPYRLVPFLSWRYGPEHFDADGKPVPVITILKICPHP